MDILREYEEVNMKFCEPMSDDEMTAFIERQGEHRLGNEEPKRFKYKKLMEE